MVIHKITVVECDTCGRTDPPSERNVGDVIHTTGRPMHAGDARTDAHRRGWTHTARGKDLCGKCRPSPGAAAKPHVRNPFNGWGKK